MKIGKLDSNTGKSLLKRIEVREYEKDLDASILLAMIVTHLALTICNKMV